MEGSVQSLQAYLSRTGEDMVRSWCCRFSTCAVLVCCLVTLALGRAEANEFVPGEVLVGPVLGSSMEESSGRAELDRFLSHHELFILEVDPYSGVLRVGVPTGEEAEWIARLEQRGDVKYAETNGLGQGGFVPNDTLFGSQWHLRNTGQSGGTSGADVDATSAWDITTGDATTVIAVLDSGIDTDHPDFIGRIDPDGMDFVNGDNDPEADHPHGSWVSGCIAASANNSFGTAGLDFSCSILPLKVLNQNNAGTTFNLAQALNFVATQGDVQIVCMSLINYPGTNTLLNALQTARTAEKILISCAGNGGIGNADVSFPGASPLTVSIGATTRTDSRSSFSGTGSALDFVAPGSAIVTAAHGTSNDTSDTVSGCSFATPITSGIAGLLVAHAATMGMTLDQQDIFDLLLAGAEDQVGPAGEDVAGRDDFFGHGRVNAYESLLALGTAQELIRGDANFDGSVNVADVVALLAGIFGNGPLVPGCLEAGNANDDSGIDISDAITITGTLFGGGGPLPAPFPQCGADPDSGNSLGCTSFPGCP